MELTAPARPGGGLQELEGFLTTPNPPTQVALMLLCRGQVPGLQLPQEQA